MSQIIGILSQTIESHCIIRPSHVPPESGLCYEPDSLGVKSIEKVRIDVKMNRSCFHIYSYFLYAFYPQ